MTEALSQNVCRFRVSMQEPAEESLKNKCNKIHCYSQKNQFILYGYADLTGHSTHQFHKEIWSLAFEHWVFLLIQHNHNVSCLIARLLQAWELWGAVMVWLIENEPYSNLANYLAILTPTEACQWVCLKGYHSSHPGIKVVYVSTGTRNTQWHKTESKGNNFYEHPNPEYEATFLVTLEQRPEIAISFCRCTVFLWTDTATTIRWSTQASSAPSQRQCGLRMYGQYSYRFMATLPAEQLGKHSTSLQLPTQSGEC